jgi:hypothetical protein
VLSTKSLKFGAVKVRKTRMLPFTITNSGKTSLQGYVDASGLVTPLTVVSGAGPFTLRKNKMMKVTVQFAPTIAGKFTAAITITSGDKKHRTETVAISGRSP